MLTYEFRELCRLATRGGSLEEVESLLSAGVDIDEKNGGGFKPLLLASYHGHKGIVELLIRSGADIHACCCYGKNTVLHFASSRGWKAIVETLVEKEADVDARDARGDTPLHLAVRFDAFDVVSVLLKAGADSHRTNNKGEFPFSHLVGSEDMDSFKLAIESGTYMDSAYNGERVKTHLFRYGILRDVELCTQLILNEFNRKHLPGLYTMCASKLPLMDRLRIRSGSWQALQVKEACGRDIRREGYCNVLKTRPLVLSMLCVRQLNAHTHKIRLVSNLFAQTL